MAKRELTPEAREALDFAAAALGAAGHEVTDPASVEILERFAMDEISIEEALEEMRKIAGNDD